MCQWVNSFYRCSKAAWRCEDYTLEVYRVCLEWQLSLGFSILRGIFGTHLTQNCGQKHRVWRAKLLSSTQLKTTLVRGKETKSNPMQIRACDCRAGTDRNVSCNIVYKGNLVSQEQPQKRRSVVCVRRRNGCCLKTLQRKTASHRGQHSVKLTDLKLWALWAWLLLTFAFAWEELETGCSLLSEARICALRPKLRVDLCLYNSLLILLVS